METSPLEDNICCEEEVPYGVEIDSPADAASEHEPFKAKDVSLRSTNLSVESIVRRFEQGTLKLNPDFQRREVWNDSAKSRLIESIMLRIPIPMLYLSADVNNNLTVVDGLQRLTAIRDFVVGKEYLATYDPSTRKGNPELKGEGMKLSDLEYLTEFKGKTMNGLDTGYYNRIMESELAVTIIEPSTPEDIKRNIFKRINTGGIRLSAQEIRNALYCGEATALLRSLSQCPEFLKATCKSVKGVRALDQELILRALSFIIRKDKYYLKKDMDGWMAQTMQIINSKWETKPKELKGLTAEQGITPDVFIYAKLPVVSNKFKHGLSRAYEIFGEDSFRKPRKPGNKSQTAISKALFEMWVTLLPEISDDEFQRLISNKTGLINEYHHMFSDDTFVLDISKNSTQPVSLHRRFQKISNLIERWSRN